MPTSIMVIAGSARKSRSGLGLSEAFAGVLTEDSEVTVDLVDLAELSISPQDEPFPPLSGRYELPTTRAWAQRVISADAVVIVTPEYNGGYPAAVKNAVDALGAEWAAKPLAVASYGFYGGVRAHRQLSEIMGNLQADLVEVESGLHLTFGQDDMNEQMRLADSAAVIERHRDVILAARAALLEKVGSEQVSSAN